MDPPPPYKPPEYTTLSPGYVSIFWSAISPQITPQNVTPKIYHALQTLVKIYVRRFVLAQSSNEGPSRSNRRDLSYAHLFLRITHTFWQST